MRFLMKKKLLSNQIILNQKIIKVLKIIVNLIQKMKQN